MLELKTKWFDKWAIRNSVSDGALRETLKNLSKKLGTVNLGGSLYKVRTHKSGQGKRGGHRTIIVYKKTDKAIFVYGFSKKEKSNLSDSELKRFKKLAKELLVLNKPEINRLIDMGELKRIEE